MTDTLYVPVSSKILTRIVEQADEHGTTPEEEVVTILRDRFYDDDEGSLGFGSKVISLVSGSGVGFETPIEEIRGGAPATQIDKVFATDDAKEEKGLGSQIAELFGIHGLREDEFSKPLKCVESDLCLRCGSTFLDSSTSY